jgi:hypothetical protein
MEDGDRWREIRVAFTSEGAGTITILLNPSAVAHSQRRATSGRPSFRRTAELRSGSLSESCRGTLCRAAARFTRLCPADDWRFWANCLFAIRKKAGAAAKVVRFDPEDDPDGFPELFEQAQRRLLAANTATPHRRRLTHLTSVAKVPPTQ